MYVAILRHKRRDTLRDTRESGKNKIHQLYTEVILVC